MPVDSPFHSGEREVQARLGVRDLESWARRVVRPYLPEQHQEFHTARPFLVAAARDRRGRPWATLLTGPEGFITSPDPRTLVIDARPGPGDALDGALSPGADLGLLGIEFTTRRRNRVSARIAADAPGPLICSVVQTFGNCPQHIRTRRWWRVENGPPGKPIRDNRLNARQRQWIEAADTLFVASGHRGAGDSPAFGMDASHRGGVPGFVRVETDRNLVFPDYAGNNYFNTIGNLIRDPRAGLLFVDFEQGSLLQLTVRTTIDWDSPAVAEFPGARRLIRCEIQESVERPTAIPLRWDAGAAAVRSLRVVEKIRESDDVTSFLFTARDGGVLPAFSAGQYLPIELRVPGREAPILRTYSLSNAPGTGCYRISVKREPGGLASGHLHDRVEVGTILDAQAPAGDFVLSRAECPLVLISAGVGITPMVSMLRTLEKVAVHRPIWFIHSARDGKHHPLAREIRNAAARRPNIHTHIAYSRPRPEDRPGVDYDSEGRMDAALLSRLVPGSVVARAEYYLCGPTAFMADVQAHLEARGVGASRIHTESFGSVG